jgi:hypothetical protein
MPRPGRRPAGAAPRPASAVAGIEEPGRDPPMPGHQRGRLVPLPRPRRRRVPPGLGRDPPVKREPQPAAATTGCPAPPGALRPRRELIPAVAARHFPVPDDREPSIQQPPLQAAAAGPGRAEPNVTSGPAKDPAASRAAQAERFGRARRQRPARALLRLKPIVICLTQAEEHELACRDEERPTRSPGVTSEHIVLGSSNCSCRIGVTCWGCRQDQRAVVLSHLPGVAIASMPSMSSAVGVSLAALR